MECAKAGDTEARLLQAVRWSREHPWCLEWTGSTQSAGYGQVRVGGRQWTTHRLSWALHHGPIPSRLVVMHLCDNPRCVFIDHLVLGTRAANNFDRDQKDRGRVPETQIPGAETRAVVGGQRQ